MNGNGQGTSIFIQQLTSVSWDRELHKSRIQGITEKGLYNMQTRTNMAVKRLDILNIPKKQKFFLMISKERKIQN